MAARSRRATRSLPLATRDAKRARQETFHAAAQRHAPSELRPRELDTLIHERLRLGIVSALAVNESLSFNELKHLLETTDGNLSVHARKLEDAGYVASDKSFEGRMPRTTFRLTAAGRRALEKYLAHMEAIISALKS
jgi:DNA-binding MarR family transcriptional regulator